MSAGLGRLRHYAQRLGIRGLDDHPTPHYCARALATECCVLAGQYLDQDGTAGAATGLQHGRECVRDRLCGNPLPSEGLTQMLQDLGDVENRLVSNVTSVPAERSPRRCVGWTASGGWLSTLAALAALGGCVGHSLSGAPHLSRRGGGRYPVSNVRAAGPVGT